MVGSGRQQCILLSATSITMSDRSLTPIFDDLPEWVKDRLAKASLQRKDWKSCSHCKVHEGKKKLMACTQCKPFLIIPTYYCVRRLLIILLHADSRLPTRAENVSVPSGQGTRHIVLVLLFIQHQYHNKRWRIIILFSGNVLSTGSIFMRKPL